MIDRDAPTAVLLLPRTLERFILRDQAEDLLRAPGVVAVEPGRLPFGAFARLPPALAERLARGMARRMRLPGTPRAIVIFHPLQEPLAAALLEAHPGAELWYGRWDRYEYAYDAPPAMRARLEVLHERAAARSALTFTASGELTRLERDAGRGAITIGLAADSFPALDPARTVVAASLGHLGRRTDWALLRGVLEAMGDELVLLLIGERHDDESPDDADFAFVRDAPQCLWLGRRSDDEAARLLLCAAAGLVPFKVEPFNDAGLPYRILKAARVGRRTICPDLAGVRTWERAVTVARDADEWVAALRAARPDPELREWALTLTARDVNAPLWRRLEQLGIAG